MKNPTRPSTGLIRSFFYETFSLACLVLILVAIGAMILGFHSSVSAV